MFTCRLHMHTEINRSMIMSQTIYQIRRVHHGGWVRGLLILTHSRVHLCTPAAPTTMSYTGGLTSSIKVPMFQSIYSITPPLTTLLQCTIRFWHQWIYTAVSVSITNALHLLKYLFPSNILPYHQCQITQIGALTNIITVRPLNTGRQEKQRCVVLDSVS